MRQRPAFDDFLEIFGGRAHLGGSSLRSFFDFDSLIHEGLPVSALRHILLSLGQPERTVLETIDMSQTTLSGRNRAERLSFVDSERAVRLASIAVSGKVTLGSTIAVGRWLLKPNAALGGEIPLRLVRTDVGARHTEAVLGRARLGGFS